MKDMETQTKSTVVTFDSKVFPLMPIKKAAYKYLRAFAADITVQAEQINCQLTFSSPVTEEERIRLVEDSGCSICGGPETFGRPAAWVSRS